MMKKAKKDEAVKLYQGMMKAAQMKEDVDAEDGAVVTETADVSHIDYSEDLDVLVAEEATLSDGFRGKAGAISFQHTNLVARLQVFYLHQLMTCP